MDNLKEKVTILNAMVLEGKAMEAFERFYHDEVVMQENMDPPTYGKDANRQREEEFFGALIEFRSARVGRMAFEDNLSMVEWHYDYTHRDRGVRNYSQVAVQEWKDGLIIKETFYYGS